MREAICPYRGLLAFREEDAGLFFGREDEIRDLVEKVRHEPLLAVIGRSGSGKSSVVMAGLIPALRRRADGRNWAVVTLRPGDAPLHALVRAFYTPPAELTPFELDRKIKDQVEILRADGEALADRVRGLLAEAGETGTDRLLLYIDQWEELYTQSVQTADADRFVDLLLHAARTSPCTVALTVRADFYADLLRHDALAAAVPSGLVNLGPWTAPTSPARSRSRPRPWASPSTRLCSTRCSTRWPRMEVSCRCWSTRSRRPGSIAASASHPTTA